MYFELTRNYEYLKGRIVLGEGEIFQVEADIIRGTQVVANALFFCHPYRMSLVRKLEAYAKKHDMIFIILPD